MVPLDAVFVVLAVFAFRTIVRIVNSWRLA